MGGDIHNHGNGERGEDFFQGREGEEDEQAGYSEVSVNPAAILLSKPLSTHHTETQNHSPHITPRLTNLSQEGDSGGEEDGEGDYDEGDDGEWGILDAAGAGDTDWVPSSHHSYLLLASTPHGLDTRDSDQRVCCPSPREC